MADTNPGQHARGWPDIFAVRGPRAIAFELKTATGRTTAEQIEWIERLRLAGVEAHLIRLPQDWDHFTAITATDPEQLTLQEDARP
jgi:Holliday junction resolvase